MDELPVFSKHTPRILRQQLLNELVVQYLTHRHKASGIDEEVDQDSLNKENVSSNDLSRQRSFDDAHSQKVLSSVDTNTDLLSEVGCRPSIQRFHGALLFVDISGFTPLSLKLDIEALKNQINAYFTKILDIVEKWGGDVVKFAGDALYIIWPTDIHAVTQLQMNDRQKEGQPATSVRSVAVGTSLTGNSRFAAAARQALEKAVACGLEISVACGKYEVRLDGSSSLDTHQSSGMLGRFLPNFSLSSFLSPAAKILPSHSDSDSVVYLDVHAGVSIGLMAGVDIGHNDRWEYFLVGEPVSRVAECEGEAEKGDVVICKKAHSLLHNRLSNTDGISNRKKDDEVVTIQSRRWGTTAHGHGNLGQAEKGNSSSKMVCGCFVTKSGLFCVSKLDTQVPISARGKSRKSRSKSKMEEDYIQGELNAQIAKINEEITTDLDKVFSTTQNLFKQGFSSALKSITRSSIENVTVKFERSGQSSKSKDVDMQFVQFYRKQLRTHFTTWMKSNLKDDIARHVHEATRDDYDFSRINRLGIFHEFVRSAVLSFSFAAVGSTTTDESVGTIGLSERIDERSQASAPQSRTNSGTNLIPDLDSPLEVRSRNKPESRASTSKMSIKHLVQEAQSTAELRTVTVMFIKIDAFDLKLMVDSFRSKNKGKVNALCYESFYFLDRTDNEVASDQELLNRFQQCMVILCEAFKENGGQLRQFIVDDKGTVCIGTFGLRGAVSADNAASSLATAKRVISGLQSLGLTGSIGITSGKAYCGLVGSTYRHEYAVMGPSTNLSARLMCKAPPHGVICDTETKNRDRVHLFETLTEVTAKGYSQPVMTYKPIYEELTPRDGRGNSGKHRSMDKSLARSRGSEHSLKPLLTAREKLTRLAESDFYVVNNIHISPKSGGGNTTSSSAAVSGSSSGSNNDAFMKLFGRSYEINLIFNTLFIPSDDIENIVEVFDYTHPVRLVAVCGSSGVGKTALVTAITRRLISVSKQDPSYNILIMQNRQSGVHANVPLYAWRPFVLELLRHFNQASIAKLDGTKPKLNKSSRLSIKMDYIAGLDIVLGKLPEFKSLRSLLMSALGLANDSSDETGDILSNKEKLNRCMDFVVQLFCCSAGCLQKFILLTIEGIHLLDKWSLVVLHKIWLNATGVSFFVTYCTSDEHGLKSWSTDAYDNAPPIRPSATLNHEFFKRYDDPERFQAIDLHPLGKRSIMILARDFFGININEDQDLENIYTASGGHPLYAVELMKSLINKADDMSDMTKGRLAEVVGQPHSSASLHHRIEEIICFRLDKLDFAFQIVLKAAAVAVSNGHKFTKDLIHFILVDNDLFAGVTPPMSPRQETQGENDWSHNEDDNQSIPGLIAAAISNLPPAHHLNVSDVLLELLQKGDFIRLPSHVDKNKKMITLDMVEQGEMEFQIPLEQATIYSILIDDQKHFFHERVALYNHLRMMKNPSLDTLAARVDEGFHWERASLWSRALRSYMTCAHLERAQNNMSGWTEFVKLSYRMYKCMEQETSQLSPLEEWTEGTVDFILKVFFGSSNVPSCPTVINSSTHNGAEIMSEEEVYRLLKDDFLSVLEVFEADHDALPLAALLHVYLADLHMQNYEDMDLILFILGVAFKLFLCAIVGKDAILYHCAKQQLSTVAPPTMSAASPLSAEGSGSTNPTHRFTARCETGMMEARDYSFRKSSLTERDCLHLLSTFSIAYHFSTAVSVEFQEMISRITDRCVVLTSPQQQSVEYIQSLSLQVLQFMNIGYWVDAMTTCSQLVVCYRPEVHAKELHDIFGTDIVLYLLSSISQRMLLIGCWSKAEFYYEKVVRFLLEHAEYHQPSSILLALIPLLPSLVAGRSTVDIAVRLWDSLGLQNIQTSKLEIALKPICAAMEPWLRLYHDEGNNIDRSASPSKPLFNFRKYFGGDQSLSTSYSFSVSPSISLANASSVSFVFHNHNQVLANQIGFNIPATSNTAVKPLPAPTAASLARAISTIFVEDVISSQMIRFLTLGGCSISSINAQIAAFQLKLDKSANEEAQSNFLLNFDEVVQMALNDSPGVASSVNALNTSNAVDGLMRALSRDSSILWSNIHDRLKEYFLDDLLALVNVWKEDKLVYPVAILSRFAVTFIKFDESQLDVFNSYSTLYTESSQVITQDQAAKNLLCYE